MRANANWTRLALIALSSCAMAAGTLAHSDAPPPGSVPPGWVWQGVWQDGQWRGQWTPGPGMAPGEPMSAPMGPPMQGGYPPPPGTVPWGGDPEAMRMADRCRDDHHDGERRHARDRDCEAFFRDHQQYAQGFPGGPPPYGPVPYAPMAFMMVPIITGPQQPFVETKTVTTKYIVDKYVVEKRRRVIWSKPRRKEKRVYTGS
jgi:hypothetical protein